MFLNSVTRVVGVEDGIIHESILLMMVLFLLPLLFRRGAGCVGCVCCTRSQRRRVFIYKKNERGVFLIVVTCVAVAGPIVSRP